MVVRVRDASFVLSFLLLVAAVVPARAGVTFFVVAERPASAEIHDSFVLPLSLPADIAHARELIARGPDAAGGALVFASVVAGADGVNRNALGLGEPLWNWHVSEFEGFGDFGIELIDGNPTYLAGDVAGWIANTRRGDDPNVGHIGFWNYTIVAELGGAVTVPLPAAAGTGALGLLAVVIAHFRPWAAWRKGRP